MRRHVQDLFGITYSYLLFFYGELACFESNGQSLLKNGRDATAQRLKRLIQDWLLQPAKLSSLQSSA